MRSVKCYIHVKEGSTADAVAVCAMCGMGICMEHAYEQRFPARTSPGEVGTSHGSMRILCPEDAKAVEQAEG